MPVDAPPASCAGNCLSTRGAEKLAENQLVRSFSTVFSNERRDTAMSLYDGFFDAMPVLDQGGNETGEYDRAYASGDFVDYFNAFIGSG